MQLKIHYFKTISFSSALNRKHFFFSQMFFSDLTMEMVRYRLIGPQSHTVLAETLEAATECDVRIDNRERPDCVGALLRVTHFSFLFKGEEQVSRLLSLVAAALQRSEQDESAPATGGCVSPTKRSICSSARYELGFLSATSIDQECVPVGIYSTAELPSGTVLGLTVDDPRLTLPRKRVKALPLVQQAKGKIGPHRRWKVHRRSINCRITGQIRIPQLCF